MLGRSVGLSEEKLAHVGDDPLPEGVYDDDEMVIVRYAQRVTRTEPIDDELFAALMARFSREQVIELCFTVGLSNFVNRFHATFLTDVDEDIKAALQNHQSP